MRKIQRFVDFAFLLIGAISIVLGFGANIFAGNYKGVISGYAVCTVVNCDSCGVYISVTSGNCYLVSGNSSASYSGCWQSTKAQTNPCEETGTEASGCGQGTRYPCPTKTFGECNTTNCKCSGLGGTTVTSMTAAVCY